MLVSGLYVCGVGYACERAACVWCGMCLRADSMSVAWSVSERGLYVCGVRCGMCLREGCYVCGVRCGVCLREGCMYVVKGVGCVWGGLYVCGVTCGVCLKEGCMCVV